MDEQDAKAKAKRDRIRAERLWDRRDPDGIVALSFSDEERFGDREER